MGRYDIAVIAGDGIGPELTSSAKTILETINDNSNIKFNIRNVDAGDSALAKYGESLPQFSSDVIQKSQVCLKGPVGESAADVILVLRRQHDLYANVRPAKSYPNIPNLSSNVDLVIVRENTEDVYLGWEFDADMNTVVGLRVTSERASRRIAEYGFKTAMLRNKKKRLATVHKANVLRKGDGLFARTCKSVAQNYPEISYSESYVDTCAMNLIRNPEEFDVIVTTNLYGDILSDEAAQVVGGLGLGPAANIGESFALFEPVHGAAFDIAGKNIANPSSILLSLKMMLEWISDKYHDRAALQQGHRIESALVVLLEKNLKTKDIGGKLTTTEFTKLLSLSMY
ncbi:MAG TPA: isocitrate/isopropylmalate dehydrogenase family protein [Candidatus Nitrosopolaris sp.]|nr:isocitrate/isopropylmalate dehydrogenase family protein [Candidatus Nitrosopolaris sp.]